MKRSPFIRKTTMKRTGWKRAQLDGTPIRCAVLSCDRAQLVRKRVGDAWQTTTGFVVVKVAGWYCPVCGASYGQFKMQFGGSMMRAPAALTLKRVTRLRPRRKGKPARTVACVAYLAWIHEQPCYAHARLLGMMHRADHAHHQRTGYGMGQRAPDWRAVPWCAIVHDEFHNRLGAREWAKKYGITELELVEAFRALPATRAKLDELGLP